MSKLTDAIKQNDTTTALGLINGTTLAWRIYRNAFELMYGNLLEAQENINSRIFNLLDDIRLNLISENGAHDYSSKYVYIEEFGRTPMQLAAELGLLEVVNALLAAGVPAEAAWTPMNRFKILRPCIMPQTLSSPLHLALANGHDAVAVRLMDANADVHSFVATDLACFEVENNKNPLPPEWKTVSGISTQDSYGASTIYVAAAKCNIDTIRKLAEKGATTSHGCIMTNQLYYTDIDNDYGQSSVLMNAVVSRSDDDIGILQGLLELDADPNKCIRQRARGENENIVFIICHTALSLAVKDNKVNFAKILMQYGATLWPEKLCPEWMGMRYPENKWFNVKSEIIAAAQQIAREINIDLQPPANYPDAYGRTLIKQPRGIVQAQPVSFHNDEPIEDQQRVRGVRFFNNASRRVSRFLGFSSSEPQNLIAPAINNAQPNQIAQPPTAVAVDRIAAQDAVGISTAVVAAVVATEVAAEFVNEAMRPGFN